MKICHVSSCFPPSHGGVETFVYNLCKRLVERGHQVKVVTSDRGKLPKKYHEWVDGIEVIRYPEKYHLLEAPIIPRIALHLLHEDYDILHVHGMVPTVSDLALVVGWIKRKPNILTYHYDADTPKYGKLGSFVGKAYAGVAQLVVKLADKTVATTESYAKTSLVLSKILEKTINIPCGVDVNRFSLDQSCQSVKAQHKLNNHQILYVGKLIHYKGVDNLIKAFKIVTKSLNCYLTIVGDGEQHDELVDLVKKLELCNEVTFTGWVPDELLLQYYRTSDLLVLPSILSRREAFGIVLLEAMAHGIPVIATAIPGPSEVIKNEENGLLVPPGNVQKLACAIIGMLRDRRGVQMGNYARKIVKEKYDWPVIVDSYENLYESVMLQGRA